jgi:hypothetical protein
MPRALPFGEPGVTGLAGTCLSAFLVGVTFSDDRPLLCCLFDFDVALLVALWTDWL